MKENPKNNITSERAIDLIKSKQILRDYYISGQINLDGIDGFEYALIAENCIFENLNCMSTLFQKTIQFTNSYFMNCQFIFCYFSAGLEIENCRFENHLDFQAGGHNKSLVKISNSIFKGFVNFFDCWYESEVIVTNNDFQKGTNLLGMPNRIPVTFDVIPIIENNKGEVELNVEYLL